jgi:hypothetical protein
MSENNQTQNLLQRFWWLFFLFFLFLLLLLGFNFNTLFPPAPPTEPPDITEVVTDEPTEVITETPDPTETEGPTETESSEGAEQTETPAATETEPPVTCTCDGSTLFCTDGTIVQNSEECVTPTETVTCSLDPQDGVCCAGVENTDLDSNACVCNGDDVCDPQEGLNCADCSYGQCGSECETSADCHNPNLTCNSGQCGGPACAPPPGPVCILPPYPSCMDIDPGPGCIGGKACINGGGIPDPYCSWICSSF